MKKVAIISLVIIAGLLFTTAVYAWRGGHGIGLWAGTNVETLKKFQKETLPLRDELIAKRIELMSEYKRPTPDNSRITTLRKEIIDLQAEIQSVADKTGVSELGPMSRLKGRGMMRQDRVREYGQCQHYQKE